MKIGIVPLRELYAVHLFTSLLSAEASAKEEGGESIGQFDITATKKQGGYRCDVGMGLRGVSALKLPS